MGMVVAKGRGKGTMANHKLMGRRVPLIKVGKFWRSTTQQSSQPYLLVHLKIWECGSLAKCSYHNERQLCKKKANSKSPKSRYTKTATTNKYKTQWVNTKHVGREQSRGSGGLTCLLELNVSSRQETGSLKLGTSQRDVGGGLENPVGGTALDRSDTGLRSVFTFALSRSKSKHVWRQRIPLECAGATDYGDSNMRS